MVPNHNNPNRTPANSPSKSRSFSESLPQLSPSPKFREPKKESKDDHTIISGPKTPRRPELLSRGLSLQMPPRDSSMPTSVLNTQTRAPLSPQLDRTLTYASPLHLLPRRSRGAEFSRACTNLHHSTLAEQSSPDSSPTITQKGLVIPRKSRTSSFITMDSPSGGANAAWNNVGLEKTMTSSSVGSVNMLGIDDSSSSESEMEDAMLYTDDVDDPVLMTPQVVKSNHNIPSPFGSTATSGHSPGGWANPFVPSGPPNFMSIHRARLRKAKSRKGSSSANGRTSLASPGPASPPQGRNTEGGGGYFVREAVMRKSNSRRESLSLHTNDLHISSGNDSGDETGPPVPTTPGVVRRVVSRRANLLPKSRQFGRIKNELFEEYAPIDSEARREAEIIRQVRESDADYDLQPSTAHSSPSLIPASGVAESLEDIPEDAGMGLESASAPSNKGLFGAFGATNSSFPGSRTSWSNEIHSYTPPPAYLPRGSSSALSDDVSMDSPAASSASARGYENGTHSSASRSGTPQAYPPTAAEGLKKSNKRRRDDDLDINSIKRRAVSPGVSVQNSPILSQSPSQREGTWNNPRLSREGSVCGHANGERSGSGGSLASMTPVVGPKRIGLQGMTDTNDGLMKMSIE
ncbi:hypothetical protein EJ05DRAFT_436600 [Pseudovirgaria hyperparasitica]|uniref:Uncharacterized protein n=1 Tax=Pseudovirgaria hyperparasitica TaxID=470096 RepID=A0A6A6WBL5_9PEZI|nr:uncharacterized protein EJ05DRAFT_436600 [Pseudovirgaria hyperparasitica]KAF2760222.1 hypothetical protein EJ05DRAFT_436600 [Pseudovirgaria hyperparasitica]